MCVFVYLYTAARSQPFSLSVKYQLTFNQPDISVLQQKLLIHKLMKLIIVSYQSSFRAELCWVFLFLNGPNKAYSC